MLYKTTVRRLKPSLLPKSKQTKPKYLRDATGQSTMPPRQVYLRQGRAAGGEAGHPCPRGRPQAPSCSLPTLTEPACAETPDFGHVWSSSGPPHRCTERGRGTRRDCRVRPSHRPCTCPCGFAILYLWSLLHRKKGKKNFIPL